MGLAQNDPFWDGKRRNRTNCVAPLVPKFSSIAICLLRLLLGEAKCSLGVLYIYIIIFIYTYDNFVKYTIYCLMKNPMM